MLTIQEMQDNIISLLGHEHPDTIYFFKLCDYGETSESYYIKFLNHMFNTFMTLNSSKLKHIHYNVYSLHSDTIIKVKCIELNNAIDYASLFRIIPTDKFEYISIIDIITE